MLQTQGAPVDRYRKYRRNAADCLAIANQLADPRSRARMITMAQSWLVLADHVEQGGDIQGRIAPEADDHIQ
jgi:hypothetical protein